MKSAKKRYLSAHELRMKAPMAQKAFFHWFLKFPWENYGNDKTIMRPWVVRFVECGLANDLLHEREVLYLIQAFQRYYATDVAASPQNRGNKILDDLRYLLGDQVDKHEHTGNPEIDNIADRIFGSPQRKHAPRQETITGTGGAVQASTGDVIFTSLDIKDLLSSTFILQTHDGDDVNAVILLDNMSRRWYLIALEDIQSSGVRVAKIHGQNKHIEFLNSYSRTARTAGGFQNNGFEQDKPATWSPWGLFHFLYESKQAKEPLEGKLRALSEFRDQILC